MRATNRLLPLVAAMIAGIVTCMTTGQAAAATNLAVFNFQLKTGQDDWVWLEKFIDRKSVV